MSTPKRRFNLLSLTFIVLWIIIELITLILGQLTYNEALKQGFAFYSSRQPNVQNDFASIGV